MSFNPHEILFRLRSQQQNTNSNTSNSQEPRQSFNNQPNRANFGNNFTNQANSNQKSDINNFESKDNYGQQQQFQQLPFSQATYNNYQLNNLQSQKNQFVSIGNNLNNNQKNNFRGSVPNSNSVDMKQKSQNQLNTQQAILFNTNMQNNEENVQIQGESKAVDSNGNPLVDYLLTKVSLLEKNVIELQSKNSQAKQQVSPQRRVKTEVIYDEVAEVISREPVDKILQKKEKNFVPFASKNSKRFSQPKVAGKLNLEQLQKIMNEYPQLQKPIINIKLTEEDLN
ncbi:hypothetical protein ABPG72_006049 [Tetrahymena utriculariae]